MRNLSFRGYAQGKGFDPLKVPDETWKLQDETERTLRGMREVRSQNLQNRNEQLAQLKSNAQKEQQQRDVNFNLEQQFKKAYHDAEMQHYETKILDQSTKIQEAKLNADRLNKLKDLAPKAFAQLADFQNKRFDAVMGKGQSLGLSLQEQLGTEAYDTVIEEVKKGRTLREVMRELHPSYKKTVDDSLNAWELIAVQRHTARNDIKSTIGPEYAKFAETVKRGGFTINQLKLNEENTDASALNVLLDEFAETIKKKYLDAGFSPTFVNKELGSIVDDFVGRERKAVNVQVDKNASKQVYETRGKDVIEFWREGPEGIVGTVGAVKNKKATLDEFFHYAEYFAGISDEYGMDFWDPILNKPVTIQGVETTLRKKYPNRVAQIDKAIFDRRKKADAQHAIYVENKIDEAERAVFDTGHKALANAGFAHHPALYKKVVDNLLDGENITMKDLRSSQKGQALLDGMTRPLADYEVDKHLNWARRKQERNGVFTIADIMIPTISPELRKTLLPMTLEGRGISADFDGKVETAIKKQMKLLAGSETESDIHAPQINLLLERGKKDFYNHLFKYLDDNDAENYGDKDAIANAALTDYIGSMSSDKGIYQSEGLGVNFRYTHFDDVARSLADDRTAKVISDDPSLLAEETTLTEQQDKLIINYLKSGGEMPNILDSLNKRLPHLDVIDIGNMRAKARGQKEIERKGLDNIVTAIDPEYKKFFTHMPSFSRTLKGYNLTLEKLNLADQGDTAIYESFIAKDIGYNFNDNKYEVVRTPSGLKSAEEMGLQLETTSVTQAMNMLNSGMASSIGAFDLDSSSIQRAKAAGIITDEDPLNAATQLAIFRNQKQLDTSTFIIDGMDEPLPGLGQYLTVPFNYKQRKKTRKRGISQKQANERFNKSIKSMIKFVDTQMEEQLEEGRLFQQQLSEQQQFLIDRIKQSIKDNKVDKKPTSRGLRPIETTKVAEETKYNIFASKLAKKGFNFYQLTDYMINELEEE